MAIWFIFCVASLAPSITSAILPAVSLAINIPLSTASIVVSIRFVVLPAALADSSARFFTCSATTAKPLPASPALAASIAAFNDNKFVCEAISSISLIIVLICSEHVLISLIASFNSFILSFPVCNVSPALAAISTDLLAAIALSSMLSAIPLTTFTSSETWTACAVQPSARSSAAHESCSEPLSIWSETSLIVRMVSFIFSFMLINESLISLNSPTYSCFILIL